MTEEPEQVEIPMIPRAALTCASDSRHLLIVIIGTPLLGDVVSGFPARCPLCEQPVEWIAPPDAVEVEWNSELAMREA